MIPPSPLLLPSWLQPALLHEPGPACAVWVPLTPGPETEEAPGLVAAGFQGLPLYVGRACVAGNLLPGFARPPVAYAAWQERTQVRTGLFAEILVVQRGSMDWVPAADGNVPANAFPAGLTADGQALYSARATYENSTVPGWVLPGGDGCHVAWLQESEREFREYEVLVLS